MLTFLAYGGDADKRQLMVDRVTGLVKLAKLADGQGNAGPRIGMIEALADGTDDFATAHKNSGFPAPLLQICNGIFEGLPADEAPPFALALVKSLRIDADIGDVPRDFLQWMFEAAVVELGLSQIRSTTREAGHTFNQLAETVGLTPAQQQTAKVLARKTRRRGIANLAGQPTDQYRSFAKKLLELVENA